MITKGQTPKGPHPVDLARFAEITHWLKGRRITQVALIDHGRTLILGIDGTDLVKISGYWLPGIDIARAPDEIMEESLR